MAGRHPLSLSASTRPPAQPLTSPGIFNGTANLTHATPVPVGVTRAAVLAMLRDHEAFLRCDPHMTSFTAVPGGFSTPATLPEALEPLRQGDTQCFSVVDKVAALPAGLWDKELVSENEFTNLADGLFVRLRSPLSVGMETRWTVRGGEEEGGEGVEKAPLELVEEVTISCSRFLVGIVKGQCEAGWKGIHAKMLGGIVAN